MRLTAHLLLLVSLFASLVTAIKIPITRKSSHHHHRPSAFPAKRNVKSNLLFSDSSIIAPISIGTPAQHLYVLLDTSSSDLALFTPAYISQYSPKSSASASSLGTPYNSSSSSSFQSSSDQFQNNYGSGITASFFTASTGKETISLQGQELTGQPFGQIQSGNVSYGPMASGILGLAFEAISTGLQATPFVQQLYLDGALSTPLFSFALTRPSSQSELINQSSVTEPGGIFTLGHLDNDQYQGKIGWSALVTSETKPTAPTKWIARLDNITINEQIVDGSQGMVANFDTGSSASRASSTTLASIFLKANGALMSSEGDYYLPCGEGIPPAMNMTISMGGVSVVIEPLDLLYKTQAYTSNDDTYCASTLTTTSSQQYDIQIGDDILRSLFVAFQYDPPQVGIAAQSIGIHNEAAAPSFAYMSTDAIDIDSPTSPSLSATASHVNVQTVTGRASYLPVITVSGEMYTFQKGGDYVSTATVSEQTVVASSTPAPLVPTSGSTTTSTTDSINSSSACRNSFISMLVFILSFSAAFLVYIIIS